MPTSAMAHGFCCGDAVVDDPHFVELTWRDHDLIELGVVGDRVGVRPIRNEASKLAIGSTASADVAKRTETGQVAILLITIVSSRLSLFVRRTPLSATVTVASVASGKPGQIAEASALPGKIGVNQLRMRRDVAVMRFRLVVILNEVIPQMPFPNDRAAGGARRFDFHQAVHEHLSRKLWLHARG